MNIREKRVLAGLSQQQLASQLNVDQTAVSLWERGASLPIAARLPELARVLGCSIDDLFDDECDPIKAAQ